MNKPPPHLPPNFFNGRIAGKEMTETEMQDLIFDDAEKTIMKKWQAFRTQWKTKICCVNLNNNSFEFNMNFWQMRWPDNMSSLHVGSNALQKSGWAKLFFSLAKLVAPKNLSETDDCCNALFSEGKELNGPLKMSAPSAAKETPFALVSEHWPLRFLEVRSPDIVFRDAVGAGASDAAVRALAVITNDSTTSLQFANSFPKSFVSEEENVDFDHSVEIMTQFVEWVAIGLFKNSTRDLIRCFISKNVFDRSRVLNQHMFFILLRDILWQMSVLRAIALNFTYFTLLCSESGILELHAKGGIPSFCD